MYKLWCLIVRHVVKPIWRALQAELGAEVREQTRLQVDEGLIEEIRAMSQERLAILLKEDLTAEILELKSMCEKLNAAHRVLHKGLKELYNDKADSIGTLNTLNKRIRTIERELKVQKDLPPMDQVMEANTEVIEFD